MSDIKKVVLDTIYIDYAVKYFKELYILNEEEEQKLKYSIVQTLKFQDNLDKDILESLH